MDEPRGDQAPQACPEPTPSSPTRARAPASLARDLACWALAALLSTFALTLADLAVRRRWANVTTFAHAVAAWRVITSLALPTLLLLSLVFVGLRRLRVPAWVREGLTGGLAALAVLPTARWAFSGPSVKDRPIATWAPAVLMLACAALAVGFRRLLERSFERQDEGRMKPGRAAALSLLAVAGAGLYADQHVYVALYSRLHWALEIVSSLLLCGAAAIWLRERSLRVPSPGEVLARLGRRRLWLLAPVVAGLGALALVETPLFDEGAFDDLEGRLLHTYKDPVYAGRYLKRLKAVRLFAREPFAWDGAQKALIGELQREYDIEDPQLDEIWIDAEAAGGAASPANGAPQEPGRGGLTLAQPMRGQIHGSPEGPRARRTRCADCNVLLFYIDTLRRDVAADPKLMPNLSAFSKTALTFEHAYASGSSTLTSLPGLVSGLYIERDKAPATMLEVARERGMRRVLSIPKSARRFLDKLYPPFAFDEVLEVEDYAPDNDKVWGYGADRPSTAAGVDRTLEWLEKHPGQRFFSWVFNFEVHNWRELDDGYVAAAAARAGLPDDDKRQRYWALSHETDLELARLLAGLERLHLTEKTIIVVLSDHGEALGEWDYWLHGVILWESLVRVPLMLRVPGEKPKAVSQRVSLIDLAPTLDGLLSDGEGPPHRHWHGMDLLESASGKPRAKPVLFVAQRNEDLVRVGVMDPESEMKLVLPLETGTPELYDTTVPGPDDVDIASRSPIQVARLLDIVVRSPLFPRPK
ncbi:MAG: sulfatase [Polyangiaceae bacterium]